MINNAIAITAFATCASAFSIKQSGADEADIQYSDFVGCWADKQANNFYGGTPVCIRENGGWVFEGTEDDGKIVWWNNRDDTINIQQHSLGDHYAKFDGPNLIVTRQSDNYQWTLERVVSEDDDE